MSAKTYRGDKELIFLLVKHQGQYKPFLYEPGGKTIRTPQAEKILDLLECEMDTEPALVDAGLVESLSDEALQLWCRQNQIAENEVVRECTLYLKPNSEADTVAGLMPVAD